MQQKSSQLSRVIFHLDMDAFFTSVEQRDNPDLRGRPVIVGSLPGNRGVVSAASYEARKYGVHSAMPINQAYARCPAGVYLRPRMHVYARESKRVMGILQSFSPDIEQISIDEAFIDMTGTEKLWGRPKEAAEKLTGTIKSEMDLTASVGIAPNKFLAKLASDLNKPDGITVVPFDNHDIIAWLAPLFVSRIWGVGKVTQNHLATLGIKKIKDLQKLSLALLEKRFGKHGSALYNLSRGIDTRPVERLEPAKSISREHTFNEDSYSTDEWFRMILVLSRDVAKRARRARQKGRTIVLTWRTPDFKRFSRRVTLGHATNLARDIYDNAGKLLTNELQQVKGLRLIGVGVTNFDGIYQTDLFEDAGESQAWDASERAMDRIAERFGDDVIFRAGEMSILPQRTGGKRT